MRSACQVVVVTFFGLLGLAVTGPRAEEPLHEADVKLLEDRLTLGGGSPPPLSQWQDAADALVSRLRRESLDDAIRSLNRYEEYATQLSRMTSRWDLSSAYSEIVLGVRRFSRVEELIRALPETERVPAVARAFDVMLKEIEGTVDRIIEADKNPKAPRNKQPIKGDVWGLSAAIYLAARLGEVELVNSEIQRARHFCISSRQKAESEPVTEDLPGFFASRTAIPPDVEGNALVMAVRTRIEQIRGTDDAARIEQAVALKRRLAKVLEPLSTKQAVIVHWGERVVETDEVRLLTRRGIDVPVSKAGESVVLYSGFTPDIVGSVIGVICQSPLFLRSDALQPPD